MFRSTSYVSLLIGALTWIPGCSRDPNDDPDSQNSENSEASDSADADDDPSKDPTTADPTENTTDDDDSQSDPTDTPEDSEDVDPGDDEDDSKSDGTKFDVLLPEDSEDGNEKAACEKVDFLFVIDNSGSMADEQANLIRSVPNFIKSIQNDVQAKDFHLLTIDTDEKGQLGPTNCMGNECTCAPAPDCCEFTCFDKSRTCNGHSCEDEPVVACDTTLGAGKRMNATDGALCNLSDDRRYFTHNQPNPAETFSCVASVSTAGDGNERPIAAMLAALSKEQQDDDGCNAGFLRKDSLLVATIISDEDETAGEKSGGTPQEWKDALVAAKGGIEEQVVVIGIIGDRDTDMPLCPELDEDSGTGAEASPRLRQFVELFGDNGLAVSVCAEDYAPYFAQAVGVVDSACDEIPK